MAQRSRGLQPLEISVAEIDELLQANFTVPDIASIIGVSVNTVKRRMASEGLTVRGTYSMISDAELYEVIAAILLEKPNTGMKIMRGLLRARGIRLTEQRLRNAMRTVDPVGTEQRRTRNRTINRRTYFSPFTHATWHLDTNMKLTRYRVIVKSCIDGKTRLAVYIDVANNNTAVSHLDSFISGVRRFGVPSRTRSDKGKENTLIARFMLNTRGFGRGSHITGRSVHNQRIERFWGNVNNITSVYFHIFVELEEEGFLNVDDDNHMFLLHFVFLPRIGRTLEDFRLGWNEHPLSTERNYSPSQLALLHGDPDNPTAIPEETIDAVYNACRAANIDLEEEEGVRNPPLIHHTLQETHIRRLSEVDIMRDSVLNGKDVYIQCFNMLFNAQ